MSDLEIIGIFFGFLTGLIFFPVVLMKIQEIRDRK